MRRLIPFIVIILVIIGIGVGAPLLLQPDSHRAQLASYISHKLHHPVFIGKCDAVFFPPALRMHEFTVMSSADIPLVQIQDVDAQPDWSQLLHFKFVPRGLVLTRPKATVHRRPNGTWDWDGWITGSSVTESHHWPISSVKIREGQIHWVDPTAVREISITGVDGSVDDQQQVANFSGALEGLTSAATITCEAKGHFLSSPQWAGDMRITSDGHPWIIRIENQANRIDAKGQAQEWRWDEFFSFVTFYCRWPKSDSEASHALVMKDWKNHFTVEPGTCTFYHAATISGGLTEVKGDVSPAGGLLRAHIAGAFQDVPVSFLATAFEGISGLQGRLTAITRFEMVVSGRSWEGFTGQGTLEIKEGHYHFPEGSLKTLAKAHTTKYLRKKFPEFEYKGLPFSRFRVHWQATTGVISFDDGLLEATDLSAALVGRLDAPRHGLDAYIRLQIRETSPDLVKEIPGHYIFGSPGSEQIQPIYGRTQGTLNEWNLRAVPTSRIPPATQAKLRAAVSTK